MLQIPISRLKQFPERKQIVSGDKILKSDIRIPMLSKSTSMLNVSIERKNFVDMPSEFISVQSIKANFNVAMETYRFVFRYPDSFNPYEVANGARHRLPKNAFTYSQDIHQETTLHRIGFPLY